MKKAFWKFWTNLLPVLTVASSVVAAVEPVDPRPNIIYILADDMGSRDMGWQGAPIETPNLDRLKREGMVLSRHYVQPQCSPTRFSFLTGNYPYKAGQHEHIVLSDTLTGIAQEDTTIAENLQQAGYETAVIGKWHAGAMLESYLPHNQGFDYSFVCINGSISYWNYTHYFNDLIENGKRIYPKSSGNTEASGNAYATDMWTDYAIRLLEGREGTQPFFLYLSYTAPHSPFEAPEALIRKYAEKPEDPYWSTGGRNQQTRIIYQAMVESMDAGIGKLMESLEAQGLDDNTLIVFSSDNGGVHESDNRPLRGIKGDSFEGGVRAPAIVWWPGHVQPNSSSDELVHIIDWYATFSDIAQADPAQSDARDSINVRSAFDGEASGREDVAIISASRHALISKRFTLVGSSENYLQSMKNGLSAFQLYDLDVDISQQEPTSAFPAVRDAMRADLLKHFEGVNSGHFNWSMGFGKLREFPHVPQTVDHSYDNVIDDMPQVDVSQHGEFTLVKVRPVNENIKYVLESSLDGNTWQALQAYSCKENSAEYVFKYQSSQVVSSSAMQYRVSTSLNNGLPVRDSFSIGQDAYQEGPVSLTDDAITSATLLPKISGWLPLAGVSGGEYIKVSGSSLAHSQVIGQGGSLELHSPPVWIAPMPKVALTRFFIEPQSQGTVYASMLVQFDAVEAETSGEVNWLLQQGWNGETTTQASVVLRNGDIYLQALGAGDQRDTETWLKSYQNEVIHLLFEFNLSSAGQDTLKVYIDTESPREMIASAFIKGDFSFDRLQWTRSHRPGGVLRVDEVVISSNLEDHFSAEK
ncbi:sulfatase-like hydrolase/transferase [Coraliomargarita sp. W4R53]